MITHKISLDASRGGRQATVYVRRNDTLSRRLLAVFTNGSSTVIFEDSTAFLYAVTPSGATQFTQGTINDDGTVSVTLPTNMLSEAGEVDAEIRIVSNTTSAVMTSARILIVVENILYDSEAVEAQDEFDALTTLLTSFETAITHGPRIVAGYWQVWDASAGENGKYVSTGVRAVGQDGADGESGVDGKDGTNIEFGSGAPDITEHPEAKEGDYYIDTTTFQVYEVKLSAIGAAVELYYDPIGRMGSDYYTRGELDAILPTVYGQTGGPVAQVLLTQAQYDALVSAGTVDESKLYIIYESEET